MTLCSQKPVTLMESNKSSQAIELFDGLLMRIDMNPIENLLDSARNGFRLFELFRLASAEQLIEYVDIEFESEVPQQFSWWFHFLIEEQGASHMRSKITELPWRRPWKENAFASNPEYLAWDQGGYLVTATEHASSYWPEVEATRAFVLAQTDPLIKYEIDFIQRHEHPNDHALKEDNLSTYLNRYFRFHPKKNYPDSFYVLLTDALAMPQVAAFTHRGRGDWFSIKLACAEQFKRSAGAINSEHADDNFPVRVLAPWSGGCLFDEDDIRVALNRFPAWTEHVRFQSEGLQTEGLFFDEGGESVGGQSFAAAEQKKLNERIVIMMRIDLSPERTSFRMWLAHESGVFLGIDKERAIEFVGLIERHGLIEV